MRQHLPADGKKGLSVCGGGKIERVERSSGGFAVTLVRVNADVRPKLKTRRWSL